MCKNLLDEVIAPQRTSKDVIIAKRVIRLEDSPETSYHLKPPNASKTLQ